MSKKRGRAEALLHNLAKKSLRSILQNLKVIRIPKMKTNFVGALYPWPMWQTL
jgi:hypothetical protein